MIDTIANGIVWMVRNWELVLGIFLSLGVIGFAMEQQKKTEMRSWPKEKLEARKSYLLAHHEFHEITHRTEYNMIENELDRRIKESFKQHTKEEWSKYK